jgi:hypothetical protein
LPHMSSLMRVEFNTVPHHKTVCLVVYSTSLRTGDQLVNAISGVSYGCSSTGDVDDASANNQPLYYPLPFNEKTVWRTASEAKRQTETIIPARERIPAHYPCDLVRPPPYRWKPIGRRAISVRGAETRRLDGTLDASVVSCCLG